MLTLVPSSQELDQDVVLSLLNELDGNVTEAARRLKVDSIRLRAYVRACPRLREAIEETLEGAVDAAIGVLFEGLRDEASFQNRYYAAKEFLRAEAGRRRGFGREPQGTSVEIKAGPGSGTIVLKWLEPPEEE